MSRVEAEPYEFPFERAACALLIIDMQRDFVDPGGFGEALGNDVSLLRKCSRMARLKLACEKWHSRLWHLAEPGETGYQAQTPTGSRRSR